MKRNDPRWRKAYNWTKRCAYAYRGVIATASIGTYRLSCLWGPDDRLPRFRGWYNFEAES